MNCGLVRGSSSQLHGLRAPVGANAGDRVAVEYDSALYPEILEFGSLAGAANSVGAGFDPGAEFVRAESAMELIVTWIDDGCSRVSINIGAR